jgi:hypothetical protein
MISFLKKEEEKQGGFMGKSDIIFVLVIAAVIGGFWFYTKTIKENSAKKFQLCNQLWDSGDLVRANTCFDEASDLQYITDSLDSVIYERTEKIKVIIDLENALWTKADSAMSRKDTSLTLEIVKDLPTLRFLDSAKVRRLVSWKALRKADSLIK